MKGIVVGLVMFLLMTSVWAGTLRDNFNDGDMDEWAEEGDGNWHIDNGELVLEAGGRVGPDGFRIGELTWKDYTVSVKLKIVEHQLTNALFEAAGLGLRVTGETNGYVFSIGTFHENPQKWVYMSYFQGLAPRHLVQQAFEWEFDTWYELKAVVEGNLFNLYVDGELMFEYTDNTSPAGSLLLTVFNFNTTAHFDDVVIEGDDIPGTVTAVDSKAKLTTTWASIKNVP